MENFIAPSPQILLIDDSPDQIYLLISALRGNAYRISIAFDGFQGYARAVTIVPDLIVLDVRMPSRDGYTVARMLKANPQTKHIPILFLSSANDAQERLAGFKAGAADYIVKPFYSEEVLERIRIHLAYTKTQQNSMPAEAETNESACPDGVLHSGVLPAEEIMQKVAAEAILNQWDSPPKAAELAEMLGIPERRLNVIFLACTGKSVFEFARDARMRMAAQFLTQTTMSISEIATEMGYSSAANFATEFGKFWKESPTSYRKNSRGVLVDLASPVSPPSGQ